MKLENTLSLPVPADEAWRVLLDIERIAPCVPGATLTERDGDRFHGKVKVKLGPIGLSYSGTVTFTSLDEAARVAVMEASGRETRGGGTAKAVVTCRLTDHGDRTDVLVETDLAITGKPAQFGRGALADVSTTLIGRFADNLAAEIAPTTGTAPAPAPDPAPHDTGAAGDVPEGHTSPARTEPPPTRPSTEPIDLLRGADGGLVKQLGPIAAAAALLVLVLMIRRRRASVCPHGTGSAGAR